jgi:hypothetical protein
VVRLAGNKFTTIADGLTTPTGMTVGPDGALYVLNFGTCAPAGAGQIVRITFAVNVWNTESLGLRQEEKMPSHINKVGSVISKNHATSKRRLRLVTISFFGVLRYRPLN